MLNKSAEFGLLFLMLKLLTNGLGAEEYGEYNLADASLVLLFGLFLAPLHEPLLRIYHASREEGHFRSSGLFALRWYGAATVGCAVLLAVLSTRIADEFQFRAWTPAAAGIFFLFDRWRVLGLEVRNLRRERRSWAFWNLAYQATVVGAIAAALSVPGATATRVLFVCAAAAATFAVPCVRPFIVDVHRSTSNRATPLRSMVVAFGFPFALLTGLQWIQGFADRYLVKFLLDDRSVGLFVAAYQVSGIPFTLLVRVMSNLLTPLAYEKAGSGTDPARVWAADQMILAGFAIQVALGTAMLVFYGAFGREILVLLTSEQFEVSGSMVLILAAGRFIQSISQSLQGIFAVHQTIGRLLVLRLIGALLTLLLCGLAIREWGMQGAAIGGAAALGLYGTIVAFGPGGVWWLTTSARERAKR